MKFVARIEQLHADESVTYLPGEQDVTEVVAYSTQALGSAIGHLIHRHASVECFDVTITRTED